MKQTSCDVAGYRQAGGCLVPNKEAGFQMVCWNSFLQEDRWQPPDRWIISSFEEDCGWNWEKMQKEPVGTAFAVTSLSSAGQLAELVILKITTSKGRDRG